MVFTFTTPAFAANKSTALKEVSVSSFVDGEGKKNTVYVSSSQIGTAHVEYYIDGVLTNTVDAELLDFNSADIDSVRNSSDVRIIYSDISSATSQSYVEPLSNYLGYSQITTESSKAASAYSYQGKSSIIHIMIGLETNITISYLYINKPEVLLTSIRRLMPRKELPLQ